MNYKDTIKKQTFIISISVIVMAVILIGTSFALFNDTGKSTTTQTITGGTFNLDYSASSITTQTGEITPQSESDASSYILNVNNTGSLDSDYNILIYTSATNEVEHSNIKVKIDSEAAKTLSSLTKTKATASETDKNKIKYILKTDNVGHGANKSHTIKVWIDENADESIIGQAIGVDMSVEGVVEGSESME